MNWLKTLEMIFQIVCLSAVFLIPTYVFFNELNKKSGGAHVLMPTLMKSNEIDYMYCPYCGKEIM